MEVGRDLGGVMRKKGASNMDCGDGGKLSVNDLKAYVEIHPWGSQ